MTDGRRAREAGDERESRRRLVQKENRKKERERRTKRERSLQATAEEVVRDIELLHTVYFESALICGERSARARER